MYKLHKMVKLAQTINRLFPTNSLSVFGDFVGLAVREFKEVSYSTIREDMDEFCPKFVRQTIL